MLFLSQNYCFTSIKRTLRLLPFLFFPEIFYREKGSSKASLRQEMKENSPSCTIVRGKG